jgi:hypothetical protein
MSDHDRGAYTPQSDAPLSFDARQARGRRAFPTTLVISLVILAGLGGAIFMFYRSGVRGAGETPTPVGSPIGEIKAPPTGQTQPPTDAAAGLQIYKSEGAPAAAPSSAPVFAAGPEEPAPRPAPTTPVTVQPVAPVVTHAVPTTPPSAAVVAASGATSKAPPPAMTAPAPAPKPAAKPAPVVLAEAKPAPVAAKAKSAATDDVGALLSSKPSTPKAALAKAVAAKAEPAKLAPAAEAKAAPQTASSPARGAAVAQFGAFSSAALASSEWAKLAKAYPADMAGKGKLVESVERDGKTLFRGAVSGFASRADAVAFCATLKTDSRGCIVR